ncbi:hypothetical protein DLH72_01890 [Candidatus Gracilibacteria bacterium]|nr:MAG: hypothetical protein DLH72_01890 [Candidatus Gracilibacteria bacterium]
MKIVKYFFNKTILINYLIQIILPFIFIMVVTFGYSYENIQSILLKYNTANSFGIGGVIFSKARFEEIMYESLLTILIIKFFFVLLYVKIIGEDKKRALIVFSIMTSLIGAYLGYEILVLLFRKPVDLESLLS